MLRFLSIWTMVLLLPVTAAAAVNVVVIAPQEGDYKVYGQELAEGVKIAAQEINEHGGILGKRVNVIVADDRCEDVFAVSMAQMMSVNAGADNKVSLVVGPYCENAFAEAARIYAKGSIMQIVPLPVSGATGTTTEQGLLKMAGNRTAEGQAFADFYRQNFQGQNAALVYNADNRGLVEIAAKVQQEFMQSGHGNHLTSYSFANYGKDYGLMAREILLNNQIIYILGESKETAKLARELKEQKPEAEIFTGRYLLKDNYDEITGRLGDGVYYLALKTFKDSPYFTETLVNLRLQGMEPAGLGVYGFAALKLWQEIATKAKSFDYQSMSAAAGKGGFMMPWGEVSFKNGNSSSGAAYSVWKRLGEEYTQVY